MALSAAERATLTAQIASLDAALSSGVLVVRHGETMTTYRSVDEMMQVRSFMASKLARDAGTDRRVRYITQTSKGY